MRPRWSPEHTSLRHGWDGAVWECVAQGCPAPRGLCPKMQHLHPQLPDRAAQQQCPQVDAAMRWLRGARGHGRFGGAASPQPRCWPGGCPVPRAGGSAWPRGSCSAQPLAEAFVPTVLQKGLTQTIVGRKQKTPKATASELAGGGLPLGRSNCSELRSAPSPAGSSLCWLWQGPGISVAQIPGGRAQLAGVGFPAQWLPLCPGARAQQVLGGQGSAGCAIGTRAPHPAAVPGRRAPGVPRG